MWTLCLNGSSNDKGWKVGVVLEGPTELKIEQSLHFNFKASNNQSEYEAIIACLHLAEDMGTK